MSDTDAQPPLSPDLPPPADPAARAPEIGFDPPDDREVPDGMAVSEDAAVPEAPD